MIEGSERSKLSPTPRARATAEDTRDWVAGLGRRAMSELSTIMGGQAAAKGSVGVVDFFCGCGGLSVGFEAIGRLTPSYRLLAAADFDEHAVETYAENLPIRPTVKDLSLRGGKGQDSYLPVKWQGPLVVIGGPPCQGFSAHGKKNRSRSDERNDLILSFARHAVALTPDLIVMENVPEVLAERHWDRFQAFREILERAEYTVRAQIHNLAGFGVPQERFRALIIASRGGHAMPVPFLRPADFRSVRDAIGNLPAVAAGVVDPDDPMHVSSAHRASTLETIRQIPKNGGSRPQGVGPKCLDEVDGFRDVYGRMSWDSPANTITAYSRNPASGRYIHPEQDRGLTVREAALLQGFPSQFVFRGPFGNRYKQIGNAVPPTFATYLAAHVLGELMGGPWDERRPDGIDVVEPISNSFSSGIAGRKSRSNG